MNLRRNFLMKFLMNKRTINAISEQDLITESQYFDPPENSDSSELQSDSIDNPKKIKKIAYVSEMQYYACLLCERPGNCLHYFGRLFHQYIVDQFSKIELGRLNFFRFNQDKIRADKYQNIKQSSSDQKIHIFGVVKAHMYVIEFLVLIILDSDSKPYSIEDYDDIISAEIPDPVKYPRSIATVTRCMIHGPCGILNP